MEAKISTQHCVRNGMGVSSASTLMLEREKKASNRHYSISMIVKAHTVIPQFDSNIRLTFFYALGIKKKKSYCRK